MKYLLLLIACAFGLTGISFAENLYMDSAGTPLLSLVRSARSSIDLEIYTMEDPVFIASIRAALARGVKVRIVHEPAPFDSGACQVFLPIASGDNPDCVVSKQLVAEVRAAGGIYIPFNKANLCGGGDGAPCFEHGKMMIVDNRVALMSTGNFDPTNLCDLRANPGHCNRDYMFVTVEPIVVEALTRVFNLDLIGNPYNLAGTLGAAGRKLTVSPISEPPLLQFINSAKLSIQVENQYLADPDMNDALIAAARRGVHVEVVVASVCAFGAPSAAEAQAITQIYSGFDAAGIQTRMFNQKIRINGQPGYMHAKAMVIDHERAWMGSINGSATALQHNREFGVFIVQNNLVQSLGAQLAADFNDPLEETWQQSLQCAENN